MALGKAHPVPRLLSKYRVQTDEICKNKNIFSVWPTDRIALVPFIADTKGQHAWEDPPEKRTQKRGGTQRFCCCVGEEGTL